MESSGFRRGRVFPWDAAAQFTATTAPAPISALVTGPIKSRPPLPANDGRCDCCPRRPKVKANSIRALGGLQRHCRSPSRSGEKRRHSLLPLLGDSSAFWRAGAAPERQENSAASQGRDASRRSSTTRQSFESRHIVEDTSSFGPATECSGNTGGAKRDRGLLEARKLVIQPGVIPYMSGSCLVRQGSTVLVASVDGPKPMSSGSGAGAAYVGSPLAVEVTFAGLQPDESGDPDQLAACLVQTFESVLLSSQFAGATVDIFVLVLQSSRSGLVAASINAVSVALVTAQIPLRDICTAATVCSLPGPVARMSSRVVVPVGVADTETLIVDPLPEELASPGVSVVTLGLCSGDLSVGFLDLRSSSGCSSTEVARLVAVAERACIEVAVYLKQLLRRALREQLRSAAEEDLAAENTTKQELCLAGS